MSSFSLQKSQEQSTSKKKNAGYFHSNERFGILNATNLHSGLESIKLALYYFQKCKLNFLPHFSACEVKIQNGDFPFI